MISNTGNYNVPRTHKPSYFTPSQIAVYKGVWSLSTLPRTYMSSLHDYSVGKMLLSDFMQCVDQEHAYQDIIMIGRQAPRPASDTRMLDLCKQKFETEVKVTDPLLVVYYECSHDLIAEYADIKDNIHQHSNKVPNYVLLSVRQNFKARLQIVLVRVPTPEMNLSTYKLFHGVSCK
jgi:hypothetical protein